MKRERAEAFDWEDRIRVAVAPLEKVGFRRVRGDIAGLLRGESALHFQLGAVDVALIPDFLEPLVHIAPSGDIYDWYGVQTWASVVGATLDLQKPSLVRATEFVLTHLPALQQLCSPDARIATLAELKRAADEWFAANLDPLGTWPRDGR